MESEFKIKLTPAQRGRMFGLIRRLESGKYKQARGTLQVETTEGEIYNCCLGIACNMLIDSGLLKLEKRVGVSAFTVLDENGKEIAVKGENFRTKDNWNQSTIPEKLENLFGFDSHSGNFSRHQNTYWKMNDDRKMSFMEIAAELRKNFGFKPRKES